MASTIVVPDQAQVQNYLPEVARHLIAVATAAKADVEALQAASGGLDWKNSVVIATTGALAANTRTGNTLLADANGLLGTIDGIDTATLTLPFRMLVKNEATQANNGLYSVTSIGAVGAKWSMTRTTDADESTEVTPNLVVEVERGTANQDKKFELDIDGPVTLNTTALAFTDWRGLAITAPADVTKAAAAVGVALTLARADHKHDVSTAIVGAIAIGDVAAEGVATSLARSDHVHSVAAPAAPADVTKAAAAVGVSTAPARADHKHDVSTAAPATIGTANAEGVATSLARSDHVHNHGAQTDGTLHAAATIAVAGFLSPADKTKLDSIQGGTDTLVAGTATIATANITASSRILITMKDPGAGAITGFADFDVPVGTRTPGTPGSFVVNAIDDAKATIATAVCTFDWLVFN